ncbi:3-deoxy-D-manno-octulosonic acid transferase [Sedimentitalea nanhaiensis]|uniref:3-deoxy-D-manno-octulosonic acid transferase n=1 Tax=Sedimentitalea nanhaiensis TaxID=999627 RepID=A0A1I7CIZ8_9RHOB|nr:glycosyltransferase N-terminal domain-containing protein [Sedimentitalea nanhaiensis]SFT99362.1 3-deoxy-D-manno-octulosonic-acid transferase [Sedimentitalea nanhaiensis]
MAPLIGPAVFQASADLSDRTGPETRQTRPSGDLVWAHATNRARYSALCDLGMRLRSLQPDLHFLITYDAARFGSAPAPLEGCDRLVMLGPDQAGAARAFLDKWQPNLMLWTGSDLMPTLIGVAAARKLPMILLDIGETDLSTRRHKWFFDSTRSCLNRFDAILASSPASAALLHRMGVSAPDIRTTDRLHNSATPPHCSDEELNDVTKDIAGRPVWLAAHLRTDEFEQVLTAHRAALRLLHRLLLVVVTDRDADTDALKQRLATMNLRSIDWDTGDAIDDNTQVVVSRDEDNLGLWYRLAPLTFMAGSLVPGSGGHSPLAAAALGSAVLYGSHVGDHLEAYARLAAAGAARAVRDGDGLAGAVVQLSAPDHAAAMALAGWEVVTEGAHLTDSLVELILEVLENRGHDNARA